MNKISLISQYFNKSISQKFRGFRMIAQNGSYQILQAKIFFPRTVNVTTGFQYAKVVLFVLLFILRETSDKVGT